MQRASSIYISALIAVLFLSGCQQETLRDKVEKVEQGMKQRPGKEWPRSVPPPGATTSEPAETWKKIDLLKGWSPGHEEAAENQAKEELDDKWRQMHLNAEDELLKGRLQEAASGYQAAEQFAKENFGERDDRRLISHFGMVKVNAAEFRLDDCLQIARDTLKMAEEASPRNDELIAEIHDNIRRLEEAKASRSGSATKGN
ncbi:MAG TPA: hypothetical protein V6D08_08135 [Candidatus Obscuribacterales bacterium]